MSETVISVRNLSKEYRLGVIGHGTLYRDLQSWWARIRGLEDPNATLFGKDRKHGDRFLALRDIDFQVSAGQRLAIIGANGAGKSTLLKILSRVTTPTSGSIRIKGRVASLLEVGTGFHPELTGRENIYLNAAILGMNRKEASRRFDEIVAFAGVQDFVDTPVKRYSSGMHVRLGFAVAAHLDPDILIVDEVLAVGDAAFQKKCLGKLNDVSQSGRTVIFVSHNMDAVAELCNTCIWLDQGAVVDTGTPVEMIERYLQKELTSRTAERTWPVVMEAPGNRVVRMHRMAVQNDKGEVTSDFDVSEAIDLCFEYEVLEGGAQVSAIAEVVDPKDRAVFVSFDNYVKGPWGDQKPTAKGRYKQICRIHPHLMNEGDYRVSLRIFSPPMRPNENPHVKLMHGLTFRVLDDRRPGGARGSYPDDLGGPPIRPRLDWAITVGEPGK